MANDKLVETLRSELEDGNTYTRQRTTYDPEVEAAILQFAPEIGSGSYGSRYSPSQILAALDVNTQQKAKSNPFYNSAQGIAQIVPAIYKKSKSRGELFRNALVAGLAQGGMTGLGDSYLGYQTRPAYEMIAPESLLDEVRSSDFDPYAMRALLLKTLADEQIAEGQERALEKITAQQAEKAKALLAQRNPTLYQQLYGEKKEGLELGTTTGPGARKFTPAEVLSSPYATAEQRYQAAAALVDETSPDLAYSAPGQREASINKKLSQHINLQAMAKEQLAKAREKLGDPVARAVDADKLLRALATEGIEDYIGPGIEQRMARFWLRNQPSYLRDEGEEAAMTALQDLNVEGLEAALRIKQPGATSDREFETYLKAGPGEAGTYEFALNYANKLKFMSVYRQEYDSFMDHMIGVGMMSPQTAESLWRLYRTKVPLMVGNTPNTDISTIVPWRNVFPELSSEAISRQLEVASGLIPSRQAGASGAWGGGAQGAGGQNVVVVRRKKGV